MPSLCWTPIYMPRFSMGAQVKRVLNLLLATSFAKKIFTFSIQNLQFQLVYQRPKKLANFLKRQATVPHWDHFHTFIFNPRIMMIVLPLLSKALRQKEQIWHCGPGVFFSKNLKLLIESTTNSGLKTEVLFSQKCNFFFSILNLINQTIKCLMIICHVHWSE